MEILNILKNPDNKYRPLNYWGWLENIQPEEVKWQVGEMHKAGLGGYVMHARGGLEIPYMGEQWLESVKAMIEQGKELGMVTIVDDEDGWPSGFGAGEVNGMGEAYWLKWLACEKVMADKLNVTPCTIGIFKIKEGNAYRITEAGELGECCEEVIHIYYVTNKYYVDNLDPQVVKKFIEVSYERYHKEFQSEFGTGIAGIFSDEPQIARDHITWSFVLAEEFQKSCGYNLIDVLPALFFETEGYEKVRYDYWNTVNRLFTNSYSKQISEFCSKHNIFFTGHTCLEEYLSEQIMCSAGTMPFYEYLDIPGIDWLCRVPVSNLAVKQVTSVGEQLGKQRILSEMYGCAGWNISFEELKWIGEWHYVLGINFMLQHLGLYSLRGSRKREYPASLFYQQPWWEEYKPFNDYFARLGMIMAESKPAIDILLIHPLKSAWIAFNINDRERIEYLDKEIKVLSDHLLGLNYDFHYGDEELLCKYGKVKGKDFVVGKCSYKVVIVPPSISLDRHTIKLLDEFIENGGKVVSVGEFPQLVEGKYSSEIDIIKNRAEHLENERALLNKVLNDMLKLRIQVLNRDGSDNNDVYCCTREMQNGFVYYLVNTSREKHYDVEIIYGREGEIFRYDLLSCTKEKVSSLNNIHFEPMQSIMLFQEEYTEFYAVKEHMDEKKINDLAQGFRNENIEVYKTELSDDWYIVNADKNSIALDYCKYSIDDGPWMEEIPVISLQEKLISLGNPVDVKLNFTFVLEYEADEKLHMVIEEPDKYIIQVNGHEIDYSDCGWWVDKSFKKVCIGDYVRPGKNEIILKRYFFCSEKVYRIKNDMNVHEAESNRITVDTELENIYLLGDFSIDIDGDVSYGEKRAVFANGAFKLSAPREKVNISNLVTHGYPFFAGKITLMQKFNLTDLDMEEKVELVFKRPDVIVTKVYINNVPVKTLLWAPYKVDISGQVSEGENTVTIELINSCRNLLGPHHNKDGEIYCVGPLSFSDKDWNNIEAKTTKDVWSSRYCFVRFGIEGGIEVYRESRQEKLVK